MSELRSFYQQLLKVIRCEQVVHTRAASACSSVSTVIPGVNSWSVSRSLSIFKTNLGILEMSNWSRKRNGTLGEKFLSQNDEA